MKYGHFEDKTRSFVITNPLTPRPWINYLGNRRLTAFISQNAGGLLWHHEPQTRRITRYHYVPAPGDRPGFYVYLRDYATGVVWNPHFAPTCTPLDSFACRHRPGLSSFIGEKNGVRAEVRYGIVPESETMLWEVTVTNTGNAPVHLEAVSYLEFGLLEFMREMIGWCYLKNQIGFTYDAASRSIRYDYHVFEAPASPAMAFGCTTAVSAYDCSREAFVGRTGSLESPDTLRPGNTLQNSAIPAGGHGCGTLGVEIHLEPGASKQFAYIFTLADTWDEVDATLAHYQTDGTVQTAFQGIETFWGSRLETLQATTGDEQADRFINTWTPYNSLITCQLARSISTDHMGTDGLRYRDTMQDALAVAHIDPEYALDRVRLIFAQQTKDGGGCMTFYPHTTLPTTDAPHRSDNTVWPIYTLKALAAETGDLTIFDELLPYRDGGEASIYEHIRNGLQHIYDRRGPHGLPTLYHADWNDSLALFQDEAAESVMLAEQLVYSCNEFKDIAERFSNTEDAVWCERVADELSGILNSDTVWDGAWYRRLFLSNGTVRGSSQNKQGSIYLNAQSWAVIAGIAQNGRGQTAMDAAHEHLNTAHGVAILSPAFRGFPEPEDPKLGSNPGIGENGGIFCHANTWAIIAESLLGNGERAWQYYRQLLPEAIIDAVGEEHYQREPYVYVSSIVGPDSDLFGQAGISWLTGTSSWMYIAATQYILGIRPTLDGLCIRPCLPKSISSVRVERRFRGCLYHIEIDHQGRESQTLEVNGTPLGTNLIPPQTTTECTVRCLC